MTGYFSTLFDPPQQSGFFGLETDLEDAPSGGMIVPVVANFGPRGGAGIIRRTEQLPGTPYVGDEDRLPHLDGWNPWDGRPVSPGRGI